MGRTKQHAVPSTACTLLAVSAAHLPVILGLAMSRAQSLQPCTTSPRASTCRAAAPARSACWRLLCAAQVTLLAMRFTRAKLALLQTSDAACLRSGSSHPLPR